MSAVQHDNGFSHPSGMQCDRCPGWPHAHCVSAAAVEAIVQRAVTEALTEAADDIWAAIGEQAEMEATDSWKGGMAFAALRVKKRIPN